MPIVPRHGEFLPSYAKTTQPFRLMPVYDTSSYKQVSLVVDHKRGFDEGPRFGPAFQAQSCSAAQWLADRIEHAAQLQNLTPEAYRPLFVPAPAPTLFDDDAPQRCFAALRGTDLLPQEICLEFSTDALKDAAEQAVARISAFRKRGFRVSADARSPAAANFSYALRLTLDTLRVNADALDQPDREAEIEGALAAGMCVMVDQPHWHETERLAELGIAYAVTPLADA